MRTRKYKKKKKKTKKINGGKQNAYEYEILKLQRLLDKYGESDRVNLEELQTKINDAIINYIMKSSTDKKEIIDKLEEIYKKTFKKREKIE